MDPFEYRHFMFRIQTSDRQKWAVEQRHAHSVADMLTEINSMKCWDVIFFPAFFITGQNHIPDIESAARKTVLKAICTLKGQYRPRLVVYHGLADEHNIIATLTTAGFKAVHLPWISRSSLANKEAKEMAN